MIKLQLQLYNGHLGDIEESGHRIEVDRRVNVWTVPPPPPKKKKKKFARCIEVTVKRQVVVSSKVGLNIT